MRLNIMKKLMLSFGVILILMIGTFGYLVSNMKRIDSEYSMLINHDAKTRFLVTSCVADSSKAAASLRAYVLLGSQSALDSCQSAMSSVDTKLKQIQSIQMTTEGMSQFKDFSGKFDTFKQQVDEIITLVQQTKNSQGAEKDAAQKKLMAAVSNNAGVIISLEQSGDQFTSYVSKALDNGTAASAKDTTHAVEVLNVLTLIILLMSSFIAYKAGKAISSSIRVINDQAARVADGDLSGEEIVTNWRDETGDLVQSFNAMHKNLKEMVTEIQSKSDAVAASATELSAGAQTVSATVNETASSLSEVSATVSHVSDNANEVADLSTKTAALANEGKEGVLIVKSRMNGIEQVTQHNVEVIESLSQSATEITKIVDLITQIADQTNLLALNAAIEAARAGDQGRGFAVVANEVRKLAEQSTGAAKEIYNLINGIQQESQKAVESMGLSRVQVAEGAQVVHTVGEKIEHIITAVHSVAGEIQSVAAATKEITSAIQNVAAATQEQNAIIEEVSATAMNFTSMAEELEVMAKRFKLA